MNADPVKDWEYYVHQQEDAYEEQCEMEEFASAQGCGGIDEEADNED